MSIIEWSPELGPLTGVAVKNVIVSSGVDEFPVVVDQTARPFLHFAFWSDVDESLVRLWRQIQNMTSVFPFTQRDPLRLHKTGNKIRFKVEAVIIYLLECFGRMQSFRRFT